MEKGKKGTKVPEGYSIRNKEDLDKFLHEASLLKDTGEIVMPVGMTPEQAKIHQETLDFLCGPGSFPASEDNEEC